MARPALGRACAVLDGVGCGIAAGARLGIVGRVRGRQALLRVGGSAVSGGLELMAWLRLLRGGGWRFGAIRGPAKGGAAIDDSAACGPWGLLRAWLRLIRVIDEAILEVVAVLVVRIV
jgi:hypothetical protein